MRKSDRREHNAQHSSSNRRDGDSQDGYVGKRKADKFGGRSRRGGSSRGGDRHNRSGRGSSATGSDESGDKRKVANPELLEDMSPGAFSELGLSQEIVTPLRALGISTPTPIQLQAIPLANSGSDVIGLADTGTGKTLAFSLPIIQKFFTDSGLALILAPTRELVLQIANSIRDVVAHIDARMPVAVLIGGAPILFQKRQLTQKPRIIVATPGRCLDHIKQGNITLDKINTVVLDEADRMLDMGFIDDIKKILKKIPAERQTLMFSATMPTEIEALIKNYLREPQKVSVTGANKEERRITQKVCFASLENRVEIVTEKIQDLTGKIIIFTRTKHGAAGLAKKLVTAGVEASDIHSDLSLAQRRRALEGFRAGRFQVLVATDIAARGIDVDDVELVINYDLPWSAEDYVHRIGRTGRRGRQGHALSMATPDQKSLVRRIQSATKEKITLDERSLIINISGEPNKDSHKSGKLSRGEQKKSGRPARSGGRDRSRRSDGRQSEVRTDAGHSVGSHNRSDFKDRQHSSSARRSEKRVARQSYQSEINPRHNEGHRNADMRNDKKGRLDKKGRPKGVRSGDIKPKRRGGAGDWRSERDFISNRRDGDTQANSRHRSQSRPTFRSGTRSESLISFEQETVRGYSSKKSRGNRRPEGGQGRKKERKGRAFERNW